MMNPSAWWDRATTPNESTGIVPIRWFLVGWLFGLVSTFIMIVTLNAVSK
jgi:hypothetical protein